MYNCQICNSPSTPGQKALKITKFREVQSTHLKTTVVENRTSFQHVPRTLLEVEKELQVCPLCYEGHHKGIPMEQLAKMHRPAPKPAPLYDAAYELGERTGRAYEGALLAAIRGGYRSAIPPRESRAPLTFGQLTADDILSGLEEGGKRTRAAKPKRKTRLPKAQRESDRAAEKAPNANHQSKQKAKAKGKQAGKGVSAPVAAVPSRPLLPSWRPKT